MFKVTSACDVIIIRFPVNINTFCFVGPFIWRLVTVTVMFKLGLVHLELSEIRNETFSGAPTSDL